MTTPLKSGLKKLIESESLSAAQLQATLDIAQSDTAQQAQKQRSFRLLFGCGALAACLVLTIAVIWIYPPLQQHDVEQHIVREVLTNHFKIKPLDLNSASINDIQQHFDKLDFSPFISKHRAFQQLQTLGGRYCTLQGVIAIQMRLQTPQGNTATYYQTKYYADIFGDLPNLDLGEPPVVFYQAGIEVQMWIEKGTVSVLAKEA